jgi:hypothetical protein
VILAARKGLRAPFHSIVENPELLGVKADAGGATITWPFL